MLRIRTLVICALSMLLVPMSQAATLIDKELPYPKGKPSAKQIAEQVFFVNQFHVYDRYAIVKSGKTITVIINKPKGSRATTLTVERYKRNDWSDPKIRSKEVAIFRSGKHKGTGMLIVDYADDAKPQSYSIWLPALRKIRRFAQPPHDDAWGAPTSPSTTSFCASPSMRPINCWVRKPSRTAWAPFPASRSSGSPSPRPRPVDPRVSRSTSSRVPPSVSTGGMTTGSVMWTSRPSPTIAPNTSKGVNR